jgi:hypothetical protein
MKKFIIPCLLLIQAACYAQFKVVAESPSFKELENGSAQILQMKNGNTLFARHGAVGGYLRIYDVNHQLKLQQNIMPDSGQRKCYEIASIFETNGDVTIFLKEIVVADKIPMLYRLVVDGNTGKVKKEEKIAELKRTTRGQIYATLFRPIPDPDFIVRKDLYSDNYAVAVFNSFDPDRNKRTEIILYGADHTELSRAYYTSSENKYKYLEFIDMSVLSNEKVCMLAYAYNTKTRGGKKRELVLASLDKGAATVTLDELNFSEDRKIANGLTRFNTITQKLLLLAAMKSYEKNTQDAVLVTIDPVTRKIEKTTGVFPEDANRKNIELFGSKSTLNATPQGLFINNDGGFSIVSEDIFYIPPGPSFDGIRPESGTWLGNVTVSTFDIDGKQIRSYLMPKKYFYDDKRLAFYAAYQPGEVSYGSERFKSFAYVNGKDKMYVLFNDVEENTERILKGKLTTVRKADKCDAYCYTLSGDNVLPARDLAFGKPEKEGDHNLAVFTVSDYDPARNMFITLKVEAKEKEKRMKLVWMTP